MADDIDDDLPSFDEVMGADKGGSGKKDDDLLDIDFNEMPRFADDDSDDDRLENDPNRAKADNEEVVFEVDDETDGDDGDLADFDDKKGGDQRKGERKKMNRLQREMRLKRDARAQTSEVMQHLQRVIQEATTLGRAGMVRHRQGAEIFRNNALSEISRIDKEIATARENGDTSQLEQLVARRADATDAIGKAEGIINDLSDDVINAFQYDPKLPATIQNIGRTPATGQDWIDANSGWWSDPKRAAEVAATRAIDTALAAEGKLKPDTDEYFLELTRRVARRFPDMEVYTPDGRKAVPGGQRQRGGGGRRDTTGSGSQAQRATPQVSQDRQRDGRVTISSEERSMLERMGVDLSNEEHRKEYAAQRVGRRR